MDFGVQSFEACAFDRMRMVIMMQRMKLSYWSGKIPKENTFVRLIGFHLDRYFENVGSL